MNRAVEEEWRPRLAFELILTDKNTFFEAGEIMLVHAFSRGGADREVLGVQRKTSKWNWPEDLEPIVFPTAAEAATAARARGLTPKLPAGYQRHHPDVIAAIESIAEAVHDG